MLIKLKLVRPEIIELAQIFRSKNRRHLDESIMLEITGDPGKIVVIQELLKVSSS
jgi:acetolactate synthase small subunit